MSTSDLNRITHGDKTAKEVRPKQRADKIADAPEIKPDPPLADAKRDVPTPPSPDKKLPDPGTAEKAPPKPEEAPAPAASAQAKPEPAKPATPAPVAEAQQPDAEATEPLPVPRPKVEPPKTEAKKDEPKKPDPPKLKLDQIAKLLDDKTAKDPPKPAKPKSGDDNPDHPRKFNPNDISRMLSHDTPQRKPATGRELEQVASLGSPTASASQLSPTLLAQMEGWFQDQFQGCWTQPITVPSGQKYVPMVRVPLNVDGSLAGEPTLINPPSDPAWRPLAESAVRAIRKCDPLPVPARFKPYYAEWRGRIVRFNDDAM
jgi:hypothetical protein